MPIQMRALRDFRGRPGEGYGDKQRLVDAGAEFPARDQGRAEYLERMGLAVPARHNVQPRAAAVTDPAAENRAAAEGPLASAGGGTGAASAASSSPAAPARPRRRSSRSAAAPAS